MIYKFDDKHIVFTDHVVKILNSYRQIDKEQSESGGILIGKVYKDLIIVDEISEPSEEDKSGRYYFFRNVQRAQRIIETAWKESNGERIYLGEWHTHPEDIPTPSRDDKKLLSNMLNDSQMEIKFLFMVIIGIKNTFVAVQEFGQKSARSLKKLETADGIEITIYEESNGEINGFKVGGYLKFAEIGYDIYNAAFSQIFSGTINSIICLTNISNYVFEQDKAFIRFVVPNIEAHKVKIGTLFDSMLLQVQMVIKEMQEKKIDKFVSIRRIKLGQE